MYQRRHLVEAGELEERLWYPPSSPSNGKDKRIWFPPLPSAASAEIFANTNESSLVDDASTLGAQQANGKAQEAVTVTVTVTAGATETSASIVGDEATGVDSTGTTIAAKKGTKATASTNGTVAQAAAAAATTITGTP
jgi:hypothetical protein